MTRWMAGWAMMAFLVALAMTNPLAATAMTKSKAARAATSFFGGAGDDSLRGYGVGGDNTSTAAQNDGADTLNGGAGNDAIWAGAGDVAFGGGGSDRFFIAEAQFGATGLTRIEDFAAGETIVVSYTATDGAPVISIAPSPVAGEVNVLADGNVIVRVVDTSGVLTLGAISTAPITP